MSLLKQVSGPQSRDIRHVGVPVEALVELLRQSGEKIPAGVVPRLREGMFTFSIEVLPGGQTVAYRETRGRPLGSTNGCKAKPSVVPAAQPDSAHAKATVKLAK